MRVSRFSYSTADSLVRPSVRSFVRSVVNGLQRQGNEHGESIARKEYRALSSAGVLFSVIYCTLLPAWLTSLSAFAMLVGIQKVESKRGMGLRMEWGKEGQQEDTLSLCVQSGGRRGCWLERKARGPEW